MFQVAFCLFSLAPFSQISANAKKLTMPQLHTNYIELKMLSIYHFLHQR